MCAKAQDGNILFENESYAELSETVHQEIDTMVCATYHKQEHQVRCFPLDSCGLELYIIPLKKEEKDQSDILLVLLPAAKTDCEMQRVQEQNEVYRTVLNSIPDVIFYKDTELKYRYYNKAFREYYEKRNLYDVRGMKDMDIADRVENAIRFEEQDRQTMEKGKTSFYEYRVEDKYGNLYIEENVKIPVRNSEGEICGIVGVSRDTTERKKAEEKLRYLSETDMLTEVYNRSSFEVKIQEYLKEECLPIGIIMGDINGQKVANDTLGHLIGDRIIKTAANILKQVCKNQGQVFRWGGDEFIMVLPNCNEKKCDAIIKKIQKESAKYEFEFMQLSIALGDTALNSVDADIYESIKRVEEKVYRTKLLEKKSERSSIINSLKKTLEEKNMESEIHTRRVAEYAYAIGQHLDLNISELDELRLAAELHDIGKIAINEDILLKPGRLTEEEFAEMKLHAEKGYRIINACSELSNVANYVLMHHERWDGKGYPMGISNEEIPLIARIISVADSYDAMTSNRIYRNALGQHDAKKELIKGSGSQFDPNIVPVFLEYLQADSEAS